MQKSIVYYYQSQEAILDFLCALEEKLTPLWCFIKAGTIKRDLQDESYQKRVAYTNELRRILYNPALFNEILLSSKLKEKFFKVFGYQGNLDFTLYPNAWLRDLALPNYEIGTQVYLADGIVLGTNQVSPCQKKISVGPIKIGSHTIFDQHCRVGLRTEIGASCIIGIGCHIGLLCKIGNYVKLSPLTNVGHFCQIGDNVTLGAQVTIGGRCIIEAGANIPDYSKIPARSYITCDGKIKSKHELTITF